MVIKKRFYSCSGYCRWTFKNINSEIKHGDAWELVQVVNYSINELYTMLRKNMKLAQYTFQIKEEIIEKHLELMMT